jgi:hypothetical protein
LRRHYAARRIERESGSHRSETLTPPPIPVEKIEEVPNAPIAETLSKLCAGFSLEN